MGFTEQGDCSGFESSYRYVRPKFPFVVPVLLLNGLFGPVDVVVAVAVS